MAKKTFSSCWAGLALVLLLPAAGNGQKQKVYRQVSNEHLEKTLKAMEISCKKVPSKAEGVTFYDFEHHDFKVRLHNYRGNDLWIDVVFPRQNLEEVNRWNRKAKFSRAVLFKGKDVESTSLESQLDCLGGVTDGMVRRFIANFLEEAKAYAGSVKK